MKTKRPDYAGRFCQRNPECIPIARGEEPLRESVAVQRVDFGYQVTGCVIAERVATTAIIAELPLQELRHARELPSHAAEAMECG